MNLDKVIRKIQSLSFFDRRILANPIPQEQKAIAEEKQKLLDEIKTEISELQPPDKKKLLTTGQIKNYHHTVTQIKRIMWSAVQNDQLDLAQWLVSQYKADVKTTYDNGRSLLTAMRSIDMAHYLINQGKDINLIDNYGASALIFVLGNIKDEATTEYDKKEWKALARFLIESGIDVERSYNEGRALKGDLRTPLGITAEEGYFDLMQLLIQKGANPETQSVTIAKHIPIIQARDALAESKEEKESLSNEIRVHIESAWAKQPHFLEDSSNQVTDALEGNRNLSAIVGSYLATSSAPMTSDSKAENKSKDTLSSNQQPSENQSTTSVYASKSPFFKKPAGLKKELADLEEKKLVQEGIKRHEVKK